MKKLLLTILVLTLLVFPISLFAQGSAPSEAEPSFEIDLETLDDPIYDSYEDRVPAQPQATREFYKAVVLEIVESGVNEFDGAPWQLLRVRFTSGSLDGTEREIEHGMQFAITQDQLYAPGDRVVVNKIIVGEEITFSISDRYRLGSVGIIFAIFFILTIIFAGRKGFTSIIGLGISVFVIIGFIIPQIIDGANPMWISLIGSLGIMLVTLYLAHGFNKRTTVALIGSLITLVIAVIAANVFVNMSHLLGLGSEEAFFLQYDLAGINLQGLLLGGIIIGVLGVLDDITTAQSASVYELKRANHSFDFSELYKRGVSIGKEHITSLVNTLALAYAGAALPLLLLITVNLDGNLWVVANSELVVEEIIRTLVGSTALILAVPITTLIAAYYFSKQKDPLPEVEGGHTHSH